MTIKHLPALVLAAGVLVTAPACAENYRYGGYGYGRDVGRVAYDNGYREGVEEGRNDVRRGRSFDYDRHDEYRDADKGYNRNYGNRDEYRRVYRQGFVAGYNEAYRGSAGYGSRYPNYPNYPGPVAGYPPAGVYNSPAAQNGYRDGLEAGRDDAHDRNQYDPVRSRRYREGDHDYNDRYGSRDEYKREYRAAFERGYAEGYRR